MVIAESGAGRLASGDAPLVPGRRNGVWGAEAALAAPAASSPGGVLEKRVADCIAGMMRGAGYARILGSVPHTFGSEDRTNAPLPRKHGIDGFCFCCFLEPHGHAEMPWRFTHRRPRPSHDAHATQVASRLHLRRRRFAYA